MRRSLFVSIPLLALAAVRAVHAAPNVDKEIEFFERQVRPLLAEHCFECHGEKKQFSELRLDSHARILQGGENGPAIVPGKPEESLLVEAVRRESLEMPPEEELTDAQIAVLVEWIRRGAVWPEETNLAELDRQREIENHWAFQPITDPSVPEVKQTDWSRNAIDHFVLAGLEKAGLSPSPVADGRTLLRRLTWNLTGLPVTKEQQAKFLAEDNRLDFASLVDELLDSTHYGERWGRYWLDVARYADTKGYVFFEKKPFEWAHTYRDYVLHSFNSDKPFDQFVREQLAADLLLEDAQDRSSLAALGFITIGARFKNGVPDILDDRIDVVMRGLMGLTVTCARCHDHKYDPVTMEDYYSLYGIFASSLEPIHQPFLHEDEFTTEEQQQASEIKQLADKFEEHRRKRFDLMIETARTQLADCLSLAQAGRGGPETEKFDVIVDGNDLFPRMIQLWQQFLNDSEDSGEPVFAAWHRLAQLPSESFSEESAVVLQELVDAQDANPLVLRKLTEAPLTSFAGVIQAYAELLEETDSYWQRLLAEAATNQTDMPEGLPAAEAEALRQVLYGESSPLMVPYGQVTNIHLFPDRKSQEELKKLYEELHKAKAAAPLKLAQAIVLQDAPHLITPRVFRRGNPARPAQNVPRRFLRYLAHVTDESFDNESGRRQLAEAIVSPANPLTARVIVNRVWQGHFGQGLVATPSNFGLQSAEPSHPELLDHLASWFMDHDWSLKALHRYILGSATYQQQSTTRAECETVDPGNRLLWKMNRRRQDWESMRDALLATAGQLDPTVGGPSVKDGMSTDARRRTLYSYVDREDLPGVFRMFDFPNPDVSTGDRNRTTVPGQSLFLMNHPLVFKCAQAVAESTVAVEDPTTRVRQLFERILRRQPTEAESIASVAFLESTPDVEPQDLSWSYGYGAYDKEEKQLTSFQELQHWTGSQWQGGADWPDARLGWVALQPNGGHPGNDNEHVAVARWTAPAAMSVACHGVLAHDRPQGNGVAGRVALNGKLIAGPWEVHENQVETEIASLHCEKGDTIDFIVDINGHLGYDTYTWAPRIKSVANSTTKTEWDYHQDFRGQVVMLLSPWERLAQVLLLTNEFQFVD